MPITNAQLLPTKSDIVNPSKSNSERLRPREIINYYNTAHTTERRRIHQYVNASSFTFQDI